MKIEINKEQRVKFIDDQGRDITKELPARSVQMNISVNDPLTAVIEILLVEVAVHSVEPVYNVGNYNDVSGLILASGAHYYFPGKEPESRIRQDQYLPETAKKADATCECKCQQEGWFSRTFCKLDT